MSDVERTISDILQEFGLSANASKAYITLLKTNPATGYEISTSSGIPRSAIYAVLQRLSSMGIVNSVGNSPKRYVPISPASLIEHLSQLHSDRIEQLQTSLDKIDTDEAAFDFWHLQGYRNLLMKLRESIANATDKIFLSAWAKDITALIPELTDAESRGVEITLFSFCTLPQSFGKTVSYNLDEEELLKVWNPKIILVVDQKTTVMGSSADRSDSRAIWTENRAITEIATNHIILDITLAGPRLNFDPNPIVKRVMKRPEINLDNLLQARTSS